MSRVLRSFRGKYAEYLVVCELLKRNYNVFFPALDSTPIDLIAHKEGYNPITIQVKSSTYVPRGQLSFDITLDNTRRGISSDVDIFILITPDGAHLELPTDLRGFRRVYRNKKHNSFERWELLEQIGRYRTNGQIISTHKSAINQNKRKSARKLNGSRRRAPRRSLGVG